MARPANKYIFIPDGYIEIEITVPARSFNEAVEIFISALPMIERWSYKGRIVNYEDPSNSYGDQKGI